MLLWKTKNFKGLDPITLLVYPSLILRHSTVNSREVLVLVEATRANSGPAKQAVVEMGSPPTGLPALVERRIENRVTGPQARTDRRSLETMVPTRQEAARAIEVR